MKTIKDIQWNDTDYRSPIIDSVELKKLAIEWYWSYSINDKQIRDFIKTFFDINEEGVQ
jgi:hypothetical protein